MFVLLFLLDNIRIRIRICISVLWIRIREAQKHMDPKDPDPQHWFNPDRKCRSIEIRSLLTWTYGSRPGPRCQPRASS